METFWTEVLEFCQSTTTAIAAELVTKFAKVAATRKAGGTLVTQADRWTDRELGDRLKKHSVSQELGRCHI